jgi:hypothetical protein
VYCSLIHVANAIKIPSSPSILDAILDANCSFGGHQRSFFFFCFFWGGGGYPSPPPPPVTSESAEVPKGYGHSRKAHRVRLLHRERHIVSGCYIAIGSSQVSSVLRAAERHIVSGGYIAIGSSQVYVHVYVTRGQNQLAQVHHQLPQPAVQPAAPPPLNGGCQR